MSSETNEKITQGLLTVISSVLYLFLVFVLIASVYHPNLRGLFLA